MATEVDPLVLVITADLKQYRAQLRATTALVTDNLGRQQKAAQNLERQMQRSSGAISGSLKGIAASLAGAFSVQQIGGLIDNFTRLQNSLRVSGLEGENLANVQAKLLDLSGRYGVSINELADLYGKSSQAAAELGASESQLLQITEASAQALKITGTSAAQAQGALLGLTQALSSGIVRAEEFNQINEGGLRPLLQAAANTEKYGGSVAKLRAAVVDGKLSSQEFYAAILKGSAELDAKASKATLTLAGAFTALASQLTVYVGEASAANGVTAGLAAAIGALADNLDVIIPLLAVIATGLGVGLVTNAIAARVSLAAVAAQAAGTTGALATMGVAARGAGAALLGAFGGPVGLAVTALTLGIGYLATQSDKTAAEIDALANESDQASETIKRLRDEAEKADGAVDGLGNAADASKKKLSGAAGAANALARELFGVHAAALIAADALADKNLQLAKEGAARNANADQRSPFAKFMGVKKGSTVADAYNKEVYGGAVTAAQNDKKLTTEALRRAYADQQKARAAANANSPAPVSSDTKAKKSRASNGSSGPTAEELAFRAAGDQRRLDQEILRAKIALATNVDERADFELQILDIEREQRLADLAANKTLSADQRAAQKLVIDKLFGVAGITDKQGQIIAKGEPGLLAQQINRDRMLEQDRQTADLNAELQKGLIDELRYRQDMADTVQERRDIGIQIANAERDYNVSQIDLALALKGITEEKRKELLAARANADAERTRQINDAKDQAKGPLEKYLDQVNANGKNQGRIVEGFGVDALKELNGELADAIVNGGNLGDVLEDSGKRFLAQLIELTFQLLVIKPLLESLGGAAGGISGGGNRRPDRINRELVWWRACPCIGRPCLRWSHLSRQRRCGQRVFPTQYRRRYYPAVQNERGPAEWWRGAAANRTQDLCRRGRNLCAARRGSFGWRIGAGRSSCI